MRSSLLLALAVFAFTPPTARADEDTRVGTVVDRQGTALVRAVGRDRWTPIGPRSILMPGDQVRTPARGANAVEVRLAGKGRLVVGPGSLVEIKATNSVRLLRGDIETTGVKSVELPNFLGPNNKPIDTMKTLVFRSDGKKTQVLESPPRWLTGYRNSTTDEWMGSLVAKVDGRDVPLSVGYHKVTVDIRDQIARTTVEQSFVNVTKATLEGVFYFPLPADASISSFGMWIGGELVEADIVEKQRARAIYEDILRQRKDPGLLEWSGGNLFKARVFPIFPHSEKRIRIQYTQVLPLEGATVRYRYALRSELLRARPLSRLEIKVRVSSSTKIVSFECPSHQVRVRKTDHAASAEFDAEQYSPERDFELRIGLDRSRALTVVPHRRDEDGYFMLLLAPPTAATGVWKRELMPESDPLDLIIVADTSGSMDPAARAAQTQFTQALLSLLGSKDSFRILTCDVTSQWLAPKAQPVSEQSTTTALDWLEGRASLGWTDLDKAFAEVRRVATEKSLIVYVGDGIGTTGDADPVALAERISAQGNGTWHAIYTSSTYEKGVLDAIAAIGGGSVRSGTDDPVSAAYGLLAEAAQPAIKDLQVKFEGLRTARVYPQRLPNLAAGTQQIVLGRFLPTVGDQTGKVTVTGTLDGKPVSYSTALTIKANEAGNSFLPRLWARRHLDALLAQGRSPTVKEEIVAFSEQYGIMTPFTSLLVLESDAQRAEYGVQRRVRMRDGERFFAEGRNKASTQLLQQQMKLARTWRLQLRAAMLRQIATLGRHLHQSVAFGVYSGVGGGGVDSPFVETSGAASSSPLFYSSTPPGVREPQEVFGSEEMGDIGEDKNADEDFEVAEKSPEPSLEMESRSSKNSLRPAAKRRRNKDAFRPDFEGNNEWLGRRSQTFPSPVRPFLFPPLQPPPVETEAKPDPKWPAHVLELMRSIDRRAALTAMQGGIRIVHEGGSLHALNGHATSNERAEGLYGQSGWFMRTQSDHAPVYDRWLARGRVGILDAGLRLGRDRQATPADRAAWPFPMADYSIEDMVRGYATYSAEERDGVVVLRSPAPGTYEMRLRFDPVRRVLIEWVTLVRGKQTMTRRWSDFAEVGGLWWAVRIEQFDAEGRLVHQLARTIESLDAAAYTKALAAATGGHDDVILLPRKDPTLEEAKQALLEKRAGFAERFVLALHFAGSQQWDRVFENWRLAEALVSGKPGASWLRAELLARGRRRADAQKLLHSLGAPQTNSVARHMLNLAQRVFQANEMLALLETVKPALPRIDYMRLRAQWLRGAGQREHALTVLGELAKQRPFDLRDVHAFGSALRQNRANNAATELYKVSVARGKWLTGELDQLYGGWTDLLWLRRDVNQLHPVISQWIAAHPKNETAYQRFVSNLVFLGREKDADVWAQKQLAGDAGPAMGAAINYALGYGWNYRSHRLEEQWWKPLAEVALRLSRRDDAQWSPGWRILGNNQFMATDAGVALRASLLADFTAPDTIESLPLIRIGRYLLALRWDRNAVDDATWRAVTDRLKARWRSAPDDTLAAHVLALLDARGAGAEAIDFLRGRKPSAPVARVLMPRLLALEWSVEIEAELFALLKLLPPENASDEALMRAAGLELRALVDKLEALRYRALTGPAKQLEKLTRAERRLRERKARVDARKALSVALAIEKQRATQWTAPWMQLERLGLMAQTNSGNVNADTRELYGSAKNVVLRERCAYLLAYTATRRKAPEALADESVAFLKAQTGDKIDWRVHLFRLLVALSRTDELQTTLQQWITPTKAESRWRIALGYLQAERGRLDEAVAEFDAVARDDELVPDQYTALANWLLVLGQKQKRELALNRRYAVMHEQQLSQLIRQEYSKVANNRGTTPPKEFDPDTLRALRALLTKASRPANYVYQTQSLYRTIKDFRVLECLPYGAIGHTPQGVYPYLERVTRVIGQVHEEATCDELAARIHELIATAKNDLDRRALLLLLSVVERRASEVLNAPGPHARKGTRALVQAFSGTWLKGERRLMASWLASLGKIPHEAFATTQINQLLELQRQEPAGTLDRLWISHHLAQTQWRYGRSQAAIDTLTVALDEYRNAQHGLKQEAYPSLNVLIGWLNARGMHGVAETRLEFELKSAPARTQRMKLKQQLFAVYNHAMRHGASVSFGRGRALYDGARKRMEEAMWSDGADQLSRTLGMYCKLHRWARDTAGAPEAGKDLQRFAKGKLPELLSTIGNSRSSLVQTVAQSLRELLGPRAALELLILQIETEPKWLAKTGRDGWQSYAWLLARWRQEAGDIGALQPRLLKIAMRALESDLMLLRSSSSAMYHAHSSYFWKKQAPTFLAVALKVIETNPDSAARLQHCAGYLWNSLIQRDRAIATLLAADARGKLREVGRWQLVRWLHAQKRWQESLPQLAKLLMQRPDNFAYVLARIRGLHHAGQRDESRTRFDEAIRQRKQLNQWNEHVLASFAPLAAECRDHARAAKLYEQLIPLHQRTRRNRGVGGGTLSTYYAKLSESYLALGESDKAVDAASAAVVSRGRSHRSRAIAAVLAIIEGLNDLDAYVQRYEKRVAESGLDAPLIRKAIGAAYLAKRQPNNAIPHLLAARDLQPNDSDVHERLLAAYDTLGDAQKAIDVLLESIQMAPLNLDLYADLGARLEKGGDRAAAERAWTTLVEVLPNEAASHRRLAEYREARNQHAAAAQQWRQVVRIRTTEPEGWLSLATSQIAAGDKQGARQTLQEFKELNWPDRSVYGKAEALLRQLR